MDEDEGPHENLNEHEMSEKLVTLIKACKNLMKVVTKSMQMTTIPRTSNMEGRCPGPHKKGRDARRLT